MAATRNAFVFFLVLFLVLSPLAVKRAEANTCTAKSKNFKGWCFLDATCTIVCLTEFYLKGECKFSLIPFGRHCVCERPC